MMKKYYQICAIVLFVAVLFCVPVCFFLQDDKEFSENENRYLAQRPDMSAEDVLSGEFMEDTEQYINDQFPQKDFWTGFKSDLLRLTGSREIGGVYLAKDGYLIEKWLPEDFDETLLTENIDVINDFAERHPEQKVSVMLVPTAAMILSDKLPTGAPMFEQNIAYDIVCENLGRVSMVGLNSLFARHSAEELYYKTDLHWTSRGAFLAYCAWREMNGQNVDEAGFEITTVTDEFQGTLYSKVLGSHCAFDSIEIYQSKIELPCSVEHNFGRTQSETIFATEKLSQKDKYQIFLNGNHPEVSIKTAQENGRHLLIIKDSFANAFIQFLLNDYETIHLIDPRYYYGDIDEYISDNEITECLFLYNIKNFCEDENLYMIS